MAWVARDAQGQIVVATNLPQEGWVAEEIADDDPELVAFLETMPDPTKPPAPQQQQRR